MAETTITKNQTANIPTKNGGKYSYQYVDIAQIHDYLEQNGMRYIQQIKRIENDDYIMTKRYIDNKWEDEWLQGSRVVQATLMGNNNPAQEQGSALTYARRYSLLMAFGLATEDDDATSLTRKNDNGKDKVSDIEAKTIYGLIMNQKRDLTKFLNYFSVKNTNELTKTQYVEALKMLKGDN